MQLEAFKEDVCVLRSKIKKAEKELFTHFQKRKTTETKHNVEISKLESVISSLMSEGVEVNKERRNHEKNKIKNSGT